jgi:hypothetical protein
MQAMYLAIAPIMFKLKVIGLKKSLLEIVYFFEINLQALMTTLHLTFPGINRPILLC